MSSHNPLLNLLVVMRRPNLEGLPPVQLPDGYDLRVFRPEDEELWEHIVRDAFGFEGSIGFFDSRLRHDPEYFDPNSVLVIWKGDRPVATASAWLRDVFGPEVGYLHVVAVLGAERGRGLGYQISLACLHKMAADGRTSAVLRTQVGRIPAIKTYLKLGFEPWILEDAQRGHWDQVWTLINGS